MDTEAKLGGNVPLSYSHGLGLGDRRCGWRDSPCKLSKKQTAVNTEEAPGALEVSSLGLLDKVSPWLRKGAELSARIVVPGGDLCVDSVLCVPHTWTPSTQLPGAADPTLPTLWMEN